MTRPMGWGATRRGGWKRLWREEDGNELLEVALVLPVFLMFTFGLLQMMLFLYCYVAATYGSRAAMRYATQHGAASITPCAAADLQAIVRSYAAVLPAGSVVVTPTWTSSTHAVGTAVTVKVSLSYATAFAVSGFSSLAVTTTASGYILQ